MNIVVRKKIIFLDQQKKGEKGEKYIWELRDDL